MGFYFDTGLAYILLRFIICRYMINYFDTYAIINISMYNRKMYH